MKKKDEISVKQIIDTYLEKKDWRVNENSTTPYSIGGLILYNSQSLIARYWLNEIYPEEISEAHINGDIHIHDLGMLSPYCAGWSLENLLRFGLKGVDGRITSSPAKHLDTACLQIVNFMGILQNEWAGAQAFNSVDTYLAPFVKVDRLSYQEVKQIIQSLIYGLNIPSRWGCQPPFTNFTLDLKVPDDLKDRPAIIGGKEQDFTYGDCQQEMDMINKAMIEVFLEGDSEQRGFQYPIPTYNITKDFDWNNEIINLLFEMTAKYGTPYFQNFINSDLNPHDIRAMCCRLLLNKRELLKRGGGLFGANDMTGSIGVVTINLPRIAFLSKNEDEFFVRLKYAMDIAKRSLIIKKGIIEEYYNQNLYPYTKLYLKTFKHHFLTIGLVGMNEACLNACWVRNSIISDEGLKFAIKVLDFMRDTIKNYQERYDLLFNLEATPAESCAYRLAKIDKIEFESIITAGDDIPYYTNSSHIPVDNNLDIFEICDNQEPLQTRYTGGTVLHLFVGEKIRSETAKSLIKKIFENYKIPYLTITPTYSICETHGYLAGEHKVCPYCGKLCDIYSRVTGYYRPVKNWNKGKREEFKKRSYLSLKYKEND